MPIEIAPNPGFALIAAGVLAFAAPGLVRSSLLACGALGAVWLLLSPPFGASHVFEQIGIVLVPVRVDALAQVFGLAIILSGLIAILGAPVRRGRQEDAALGVFLGGAVAAVFAGDLVSFVAASELSALAAGWLILSAGGERSVQAGARVLIWQAPASIALLAGCAFQLSFSGTSAFSAMPIDEAGGALICLGLLMRVGAPLFHPWLKDAAAGGSAVGGPAAVVVCALLASYGLARGFAGVPVLAFLGAGMAGLGAVYAFIESNPRRALAAGAGIQFGIVLMALSAPEGSGTAGASGLAFAAAMGLMTLASGLGVAYARTGGADAGALGGLAGSLPLSAAAAVTGGLSLAAAPGLAGFAAATFAASAFDAAPSWVGWAVLFAQAAAVVVLACRIPAVVFFGQARGAPLAPAESRFGVLLSLLLGMFFCIAVGAAPGWLAALLPGSPVGAAGDAAALVDHALLISAGAAGLALATTLRVTSLVGVADPPDVDALYRGPLAALLRWIGVLTLRLAGAVQAQGARAWAHGRERLIFLGGLADRPFRPAGPGLAASIGGSVILLFLTLLFL